MMKLAVITATGLAFLALASPCAAGLKAVVELFTSQGCSSCPPADHFLAELARREDVLALSLPVDYWNYLGWKDTLGRPEHTQRQHAYAQARGDGRVYTPQVVVNGRHHFVGGDRAAIEAAIRAAELPVEVAVSRNGETIDIVVEAAPAPRPLTVRLVTYDRTEEVAIGRGENLGRTITYHNIVKEMRPIGMWKGERLEISLPLAEIMANGANGCAVLLQEDGKREPGAILGAARLDD